MIIRSMLKLAGSYHTSGCHFPSSDVFQVVNSNNSVPNLDDKEYKWPSLAEYVLQGHLP